MFFRKGKKKQDMAEGKAADNEWPEEFEQQGERVRVNDRRRVGREDASAEGETAEPSLKPSYVEELESRARAAEQKAADVQARFEQVRAELKLETDEVRQRLARTADERVAREKANFIAALLPVVDNLQRALEAAEAGGDIQSLTGGLRGTISC